MRYIIDAILQEISQEQVSNPRKRTKLSAIWEVEEVLCFCFRKIQYCFALDFVVAVWIMRVLGMSLFPEKTKVRSHRA